MHMAVWLHVKVCWRGLRLRPIGCTPAGSVTFCATAVAVCGMLHYISLMP